MNLIWLSAAWIAGVVAADWAGAGPGWAWPLALAGLALGAGGAAARRSGRGAAQGAGAAALLLGAALLGGGRLCGAQRPPPPGDVSALAGRGAVALAGWVSADPQRTEEGQRLTLAVEVAGGRAASGSVLVSLPPLPEYRYGQRLRLTGELDSPRGPKRPGEFDYRAYLRRRGIFVTMADPRVRVIGDGAGAAPLRALADFRDRCRGVLLRELPEPQASIAVGVLLGLQSSIPDDVYKTFSDTGTSHILVVSGWNFTIVAGVLSGLSRRLRLGRWAALALALVALWAYALFVGATGTVLRAAVMASLMVFGRAAERRSEPWRLLCAACVALSAYDPQVLWDLGFQLSALATASLFAYGAPVGRLVERAPGLGHPAMGWAAEALTATLAAQVLALPVLLYQFGRLSLVAPLANILLVPVVPYTMLLGTVALAAGLVWLPLGQAAALAAWLPLAWLTEGARLFAQVPWASVDLPPFPLWQLLAYYALAAAVYGGWLHPYGAAAEEGRQQGPAA